MEEVEPVPHQSPGKARQLRDGIPGRIVVQDLEVGGQVRKRVAVGAMRVHAEVIGARLGKLADRLEQVTDVGPDPVVLELARVDADARHGDGSPAASASTAAVPRAAASQENFAARSGPAAARRSRVTTSSRTRSICRANPAESHGSAKRAAPPATSRRASAVEATTGVPQAMASRTGRPKPSASEG